MDFFPQHISLTLLVLQVISEEHVNSDVNQQAVAPAATSNEEVNSVITDDLTVPIEDVRVWIDPLDATQEYTGMR